MTPLELKKMKIELMKVTAARMDLECRIEDCKADLERLAASYKENITRLESNIQVQLAKEAELTAKIEEASKS